MSQLRLRSYMKLLGSCSNGRGRTGCWSRNGTMQLRTKVCGRVEVESHISVQQLYTTISDPEPLDKQMMKGKSSLISRVYPDDRSQARCCTPYRLSNAGSFVKHSRFVVAMPGRQQRSLKECSGTCSSACGMIPSQTPSHASPATACALVLLRYREYTRVHNRLL